MELEELFWLCEGLGGSRLGTPPGGTRPCSRMLLGRAVDNPAGGGARGSGARDGGVPRSLGFPAMPALAMPALLEDAVAVPVAGAMGMLMVASELSAG